MSRVSSFVTVSVTHPETPKWVSVPNTKTLAILKCEENYDRLKVCAWPVLEEINELLQCNTIENNGETYIVDIYFGGDMKF